MVSNKSPDEIELTLIIALLCDVQKLHSGVISPHALRLTIEKVRKRYAQEGMGFLTKSLPRLGRALDRALSGNTTLDAVSVAFEPQNDSKLPKFLWELFSRVFSSDGQVLPSPDVECVKSLRQVLFMFYKYELPSDPELDADVVSKFVKTENDVLLYSQMFDSLANILQFDPSFVFHSKCGINPWVIRRARRLLFEVFRDFDVRSIEPRHGPGTVATRECLDAKYRFSSFSPRLAETYPLDEYLYSNLGHVSAVVADEGLPLTPVESFARVCLVPKDSRGPRLISCEPLVFQWFQQGLGRAIVQHVEEHPLTRYSIHFTDQTPNRLGAILGSYTGNYATLDLNEASDRVSVGLVRLLFPEPLQSALLNCRTLATVLPSGKILKLSKFAPMGSSLCFPVLALTIWAILAAMLDTRVDGEEPSILVYGDDVIVPTAQAENAITTLESFGLKINRDKSFVRGFFRESCGADAFHGIDVTPVKLHTVWQHHPDPGSYVSFVEYANEFYHRGFLTLYECIQTRLENLYGYIPDTASLVSAPSLEWVPVRHCPERARWNKRLQCREILVREVRARTVNRPIDGYVELFRFLSTTPDTRDDSPNYTSSSSVLDSINRFIIGNRPFTAGQYTVRQELKFSWVWRSASSPVNNRKPNLSLKESAIMTRVRLWGDP